MAQTDREALAALYHATGGPSWKNSTGWDTDADLSDWHGVKTNGQGRVVELDLRQHNLQGTIPPELGKLTALQTVILHRNQLSGLIPAELGNLAALEKLDLSGNKLSGPIPPELGNLGALTLLNLSRNQLSGHIPPQLGDLGVLVTLFLSNNKLDGPIPPELGKLTALMYLDLENNQLSGHIPRQLGDLGALESLELNDNRLEGAIPAQLGDLNKLTWLDLSENQLSGPIPPELGNLAALQRLDLDQNGLSGHIPPQLGDLGALVILSLSNNKLDGHIPPQLGDLGALVILSLSSNKLDGPIPDALGNLSKLETLRMHDNQLTGSIPKELGALTELKELWLQRNELTGHIPRQLGDLGALETLELSNNRLEGNIPPQLGQLGALEFLNLANNKLDGSIPSELGKLTTLKELHLWKNQLSGAIPAQLGALDKLIWLDLSTNQLSGPIPPELGNLAALQRLNARNNQLSGTIPGELGKLTALTELHLHRNNLSGPIPPELGNLRELRTLRLYTNQLTGPIPKELGALSKLEQLWLQTNGLTGNIPPQLGQLGALEFLNLANNKLDGLIPVELGNVAALRVLNISGNKLSGLGETEDALRLVQRLGTGLGLGMNPWTMPPEAVVEAGLPAVKEYLLDVREAKKTGADVTSLQLLKVVLVGSASAGKTSLMQSIIAERGSPTKGTPAQASTVGMELRSHRLQNTKVEFFDCAGQVDYAGMHQTFLTRRALYLLVVDIAKCVDVDDLDEIIHDDIMRWLYYLYLRAPGSTVILVANKCDGSIDNFKETAEGIQQRVGELLSVWHDARGLRGRSKGRVTDVTLLPGMSRVSCHEKGSPEASGLSALTALISRQTATSILVPPAWDLALEVIDALRTSCDPTTTAREKLGLANTPPSGGGDGDVHAFAFISKGELFRKWKRVVENVRGDVQEAMISHWENALNGALWVSDFAGHTLRIDGGDGIFLDVLWLSKVLNPIVSHKLKNEFFDDVWTPMKRKLVTDKVLRRPFAMHLWNESIGSVTMQSEDVVEALFRTLIKLGVALPLGHTADGASSAPQDMLVIMRLDEKCDGGTRKKFEEYTSEKQPEDREVTLKWKFDRAGPPQGLVERLIASCHVLGKVKSNACWRYGAVFKSHFKRSLAEGNGSLYTVGLSMASYNDPERELTARIVGPLESARVWAAVRYVASAVVTFSKEWPGVLWEGWPECAKHHEEKVFLASSAALGDLLLPAAAPDANQEDWCDCLPESSGVLPLVLKKLGVVIDTGKDPFEGLPEEVEDAPEENAHDVIACHCVREAFARWQPYAWRTTKWLFALAVLLFTTAVVAGIVEDEDALWKSSLGVVGLLVVISAVSSVFACRHTIFGAREEQTQSGQQVTPADVATFA